MTARDVVPQPAEPRGFLRRRKTDEPYPHHPVVPAVEVVESPVAEAPVPAPAPEPAPVVEPPPVVEEPALEAPLLAEAWRADETSDADEIWLFEELAAAPSCAQCEERSEADELFRAQASLLKAALRQADELEAALANEQHERREETARLRADNELLRNALAVLNAEAINRQQVVEAPLPRDPFARMVPDQRDHGSPLLRPVVDEPPAEAPQVSDRSSSRHGRRRSGRDAGPA